MRPLCLLLGTVLVGYLLIVAALYLGQRRLLYLPAAQHPMLGDLIACGATEVMLQTDDGLKLFSWYLPPPAGAPVIVYFHGNGGDIGMRRPWTRVFAEAGFGVLMVEYRGYAGNPGSPTEAGLVTDGRAALAFLGAREVSPDRRVLYGESLGTGVAVQLAASHPVAAVVLASPYTSIADVAQYHYPWVPVRWLLHDKFDSLALIGRVRAPMLFMHAEHDTVIPVRFHRALYAAAPEPKEIWSTEQGGHNDVGNLGGLDQAIAFVRRRLGARVVDHAVANG
jgi:uncharacterized protein